MLTQISARSILAAHRRLRAVVGDFLGNAANHQTLSISASPAPPKIASDLYAGDPDEDVRAFYQGEAMEKTLAWAEGELEGFIRS